MMSPVMDENNGCLVVVVSRLLPQRPHKLEKKEGDEELVRTPREVSNNVVQEE